ncbi:tRNA methyltransferase, has a role in tRNA modification [Linnemannia exigua]|uniref:tRNA methyltransferase, has a role in tRNA modification n=1 Tax=Linnemannia exigua TaxID=604196 RepID=A0AAD4DE44_9FUNG|nr:tRNA methyltransferase, has a role in tRNA modification [Linnemannia exigua]
MSTKNPLHIPSPFQADLPDMTPEEKEQQYVHSVYQAIAPHFSATRYKPWPVVEEFLKTMPAGYVGADVGCGNGKYIGVNDKLFMVGSDRSSNLISICGERGHEAMVCDGLALPYRPQFFDFAISIAVIHHFISPERRVAAIEEILRIVRVGGRVLIFVWALEQTGKRDFDKETQDVFVPWALTKKPAAGSSGGEKQKKKKEPKANSRPQGVKKKDRKNNNSAEEEQTTTAVVQDEVKKGKIKEEGEEDGSVVTESLSKLTIQGGHTDSNSSNDKDDSNTDNNLLQDQSSTADSFSSSSSAPTATAHTTEQPTSEDISAAAPVVEAPVYNRYYHLFHKGELEDLVLRTNKASIVQQGYDRDNWWCILEKTHHE